MKALRRLRIETMGGRVPKTGRLYFLYHPYAEWSLATGMEESLLYKGVQTCDTIERE